MKKLILLFTLLFSSAITCVAQKKPFIDNPQKITEIATKQLDADMQAPEGVLFLWAQKNKIKGTYTLDISIAKNGKVVNVFVKEKDSNATIPHQNKLKDRIFIHKFNMKLPKGKIYKFEYTFNFE